MSKGRWKWLFSVATQSVIRSDAAVATFWYNVSVDSVPTRSGRGGQDNYDQFDAGCQFQGKGNHEHAEPCARRAARGGGGRRMIGVSISHGVREQHDGSGPDFRV